MMIWMLMVKNCYDVGVVVYYGEELGCCIMRYELMIFFCIQYQGLQYSIEV